MNDDHNVIPIGLASNDASRISVTDMISNEAKRCNAGENHKFNKAIIIYLNDEDQHYDIAWSNAGMRLSEIIALLDIAKHNIVNDIAE